MHYSIRKGEGNPSPFLIESDKTVKAAVVERRNCYLHVEKCHFLRTTYTKKEFIILDKVLKEDKVHKESSAILELFLENIG